MVTPTRTACLQTDWFGEKRKQQGAKLGSWPEALPSCSPTCLRPGGSSRGAVTVSEAGPAATPPRTRTGGARVTEDRPCGPHPGPRHADNSGFCRQQTLLRTHTAGTSPSLTGDLPGALPAAQNACGPKITVTGPATTLVTICRHRRRCQWDSDAHSPFILLRLPPSAPTGCWVTPGGSWRG